MAHESAFYEDIEQWFKANHGCQRTGQNCKYAKNSLLSADVVGWKNSDGSKSVVYACELKPFPFPLGSEGRGSVGQAVALRRLVDYLYVACVSSEAHAAAHWGDISKQDNYKHLFQLLGLVQPVDFAGYVEALRAVFDWFYTDLGIGLLLVADEDSKSGTLNRFDVTEIASAKPSNYRMQATAGGLCGAEPSSWACAHRG